MATDLNPAEYIEDDEPVCVNCDDEGCEFCEPVEDQDDFDEDDWDDDDWDDDWEDDDLDDWDDDDWDEQPFWG